MPGGGSLSESPARFPSRLMVLMVVTARTGGDGDDDDDDSDYSKHTTHMVARGCVASLFIQSVLKSPTLSVFVNTFREYVLLGRTVLSVCL